MKNVHLFYIVVALYGAALIKATEYLIQNNIPVGGAYAWLAWVLINGFFIGRQSSFVEAECGNKKSRKKK